MWFKKKRKGLLHLGNYGGHDWYRLNQFGDNTNKRYLYYTTLLSQYEELRLKLSDLKVFADTALQLSSENKSKDLHSHLNLLKAYIELEEKNSIIFELVSCFVLIDDEPVDDFSFEFTDKKRKAFNESMQVQVFFCELYNILQNKPESYAQGLRIWEYTKSRMSQVTELAFLNAISKVEP
jgi:hypothetical protein